MLKKIVFWGLMISCILGFTMAVPAQAALIPNGDFEACDLTAWNSTGDVGIDGISYAINGACSGFVNNDAAGGSIGGVCSWLWSDDVYPTYIPKSILVKFKVRYSTTEPIFPTQVEDPFHAMLKFDDGNGDVTMVTVSANAVSVGPGFSVQDLLTGTVLPARSNPPWALTALLGWDYSSDIMLVSGTIPYTGCAPVNIRFDICNSLDTVVPSYAQVDDVDITFVNAPGAATTWWKFPPGSPILCP